MEPHFEFFDAMVSARPYRAKLDQSLVRDSIRWESGRGFDPDFVQMLVRVMEGGWTATIPQDQEVGFG